MRNGHRCITVGVVVCMASLWAQAQTIYMDPAGNFRLTMPSGFVSGQKPPQLMFMYTMPPRQGDPPFSLWAQGLGDLDIPHRLPNAQEKAEIRQGIRTELPPGLTLLDVTVSQRTWKDVPINVIEATMSGPGGSMVTMTAQVPLKGQAINLVSAGPAKDRVNQYLQQALNGLEGQSSWFPPPARLSNQSEKSYSIALLIIMGLVFLGGLFGLWALSRVSPKGVVLAVAAAIWLTGQFLARTSIRELHGLGGALSLLGFAGAILGIADLFRKRRQKAPSESAPPPLAEQTQPGASPLPEANDDRQ
jgi:hypothetical protein